MHDWGGMDSLVPKALMPHYAQGCMKERMPPRTATIFMPIPSRDCMVKIAAAVPVVLLLSECLLLCAPVHEPLRERLDTVFRTNSTDVCSMCISWIKFAGSYFLG